MAIEIEFDTEGKTYCPMKGTATLEDCAMCIYRQVDSDKVFVIVCIYKDIFPEEGMGLNA